MSRILNQIRSNLIGYVALFLALTGGAAYAAIGSGGIRNDSIRVVDLDFPDGSDGVTRNDKVTLAPKAGFPTVARTALSVDDRGGSAAAFATVELTNDTGSDADVTLRLQHRGHPEHTADFTTTVPDGASLSAPASLQCNGFPAGRQKILLRVLGPAGITIGTRTLVATLDPEQ